MNSAPMGHDKRLDGTSSTLLIIQALYSNDETQHCIQLKKGLYFLESQALPFALLHWPSHSTPAKVS